MNVASLILTSLIALTFQVHAEDSPASKLISEMHGVYKYRFIGSDTSGNKWKAENIVEIVPFDDAHVYFRAYLETVNGHNCHVYGIAAHEDGKFVYRDPQFDEIFKQRCTLNISLTKTKLQLSDTVGAGGESTCPMYCGARARLDDFSIARSSRREIRYLKLVKASRQYLEAVDAFTKTTKSTKNN